MPLHWFWPPVCVTTDKPGKLWDVTNVELAAEFLLYWREIDECGPAWKAATEACLRALEGKIPPQDVRPAFEAAARECGRLIPGKMMP
jgi:hypothetical protein